MVDDDSILEEAEEEEEEEHDGSSKFVVFALAENENMAADRNKNQYWEGKGGRNGRLHVVEATEQNYIYVAC